MLSGELATIARPKGTAGGVAENPAGTATATESRNNAVITLERFTGFMLFMDEPVRDVKVQREAGFAGAGVRLIELASSISRRISEDVSAATIAPKARRA